MHNAGMDDSQAGIKSAGENINNLRYADDTTLIPGAGNGNPVFLLGEFHAQGSLVGYSFGVTESWT